MLKKNIYKWHRTCSLIIAIPVLLWAVSGFMHPVMTSFRPKIATQALPVVAIDTARVKVPLQVALQQNHIDSFNSLRLIHIDTNWFYQVKKAVNGEVAYISVNNGKLLKRGDWLYAQYIARIFLEGSPVKDTAAANQPAEKVPDCCDAAELCVLNITKGAPVKNVTVVTSFNAVYSAVNRVLPVYQVAFDRPDSINIYVETLHDRFAFAADGKRVAFSTFFSMVHTWGWLQFLGKGKLVIEVFLAGLTFVTSLMGVYIFFTTKSKKAKGNTVVKARRTHRYTSIAIALFTLMFSFSGCYHAASKFSGNDNRAVYVNPVFQSADVNMDIGKIASAVHVPISGLSLVKMNNYVYWQVFAKSNATAGVKDLMKDKQAQSPKPVYLTTSDYKLLPAVDEAYATYLAEYYSNLAPENVQSAELVTKFNAGYSFADKILPVWKITYNNKQHQKYYIETSSGMLSKISRDGDETEHYSFAFLHKHEFLSGFGKSVKDFSTMFWAAAQVAMVAIGLTLYVIWQKKQRKTVPQKQ